MSFSGSKPATSSASSMPFAIKCTARAAAELWAQIRTEDWSLVSSAVGPSSAGWSGWPQRLWKFEKHYQHIGSTGAAGIGYGAPATVGAALANRKHGRLSVSIQND